MKNLMNTNHLLQLFDEYIKLWHVKDKINYSNEDMFLKQALEILSSNYKLWHLEDLARDINADDKIIADVKRKIDKQNQIRNDNIEKLDIMIFNYLNDNNIAQNSDEFNSETPGSIVDRITILSLKIFHMDEETRRENATKEHIENCKEKLKILHNQRNDLSLALKNLLNDIINGNKKHKIYFQFKMYNDPDLNPVLYKKSVKN
jgi:hypothetical protein